MQTAGRTSGKVVSALFHNSLPSRTLSFVGAASGRRALAVAAHYSRQWPEPLPRRAQHHWASGVILAGISLAALPVSRRRPVASNEEFEELDELSLEEQRTVALFDRCSASVVHINTFIEHKGLVLGSRGFQLNLMEIPQGTGSGFVWDEKHVVTNYHVIKDAARAVVVLSDHSTCEATLVGVEPDSDLAVLRILPGEATQTPLVPLQRGRSHNVQVGQKVFAIGNPFGLDQTLTSGIVSGLARQMRGVTGRTMRDLIQTDAAINPGNSGGPLLDARGRLIGVNTMIASPSGAFAGVGFAIPVDKVVRVVQQLVKYGHAKYPFLGVTFVPDHVRQQISAQLMDGSCGVFILSVEPGSPADKAGLRGSVQTKKGIVLGDEIVAVDGQKVRLAEEVADAVIEHQIGDEVTLTVKRRGQAGSGALQTITVSLIERPERLRQGTPRGNGFFTPTPEEVSVTHPHR